MALLAQTTSSFLTIPAAQRPFRNTETHSAIFFMYRTADSGGVVNLYRNVGSTLANLTDSTGAVLFRMGGTPNVNSTSTFSNTHIGKRAVCGYSWDAVEFILTTWALTEDGTISANSTDAASFVPASPSGDTVIGLNTQLAGTGMHQIIGFDHLIDQTDFEAAAQEFFDSGDAFWSLFTTDGNFTGTFKGVSGASTGCIFVLDWGPLALSTTIGALPNADLTVNNLDGFNYHSTADYSSDTIRSVIGTAHPALTSVSTSTNAFKKVGMFDPNYAWFTGGTLPATRATNYAGGSLVTRSQIAPHTRGWALGSPVGSPSFFGFTANSRAVKLEAVPTVAQNWPAGFTAQYLAMCSGYRNAPSTPSTSGVGNLIFTRNGTTNTAPTTSGTVNTLGDYGRLWTGVSSGTGNGRGVVLRSDDAAWSSKIFPVTGSLFNADTQPVTLELFYLIGPGMGTFTYDVYKGTANNSLGTLHESGTTVDCDSTAVTHSMVGTDNYNPTTNVLTIDETPDTFGIEVGMMVMVSSGTGVDSISEVVAREIQSGDVLLTLSHDFGVTPTVAGSSVLKFGHYSYGRLLVNSAALASGGPGRGFNIVAPDGSTLPVVLFGFGGWATGVNGIVCAGVGKSGAGYTNQYNNNLPSSHVRMFEALRFDAVFQFIADQGSSPSAMATWKDIIVEGLPDAEIWWCGDCDALPDLSTWHSYMIANAASQGVGLIDPCDELGDIYYLADQGWLESAAHMQSTTIAQQPALGGGTRAIGTNGWFDHVYAEMQNVALAPSSSVVGGGSSKRNARRMTNSRRRMIF